MMASTAEVRARRPDVRLGRGPVDPVWRHAPTVLLRYPALFAAVAFGTMLLTLAAAAYPLFLSATASELVRAAVERPNVTRYSAGLTFTYSNLPLEPVTLSPDVRTPPATALDEPFRRLAAESPVLDEPIVTVLGETVTVSVGADETREGRLFASTGVLEHVEPISGEDGDGVWLPDLIADALGAGPGDTITLADAGGGTATVAVDGVYRAVYRTALGGYWLQWQEFFQVPCGDCSPLPQPILGDRDQVLDLARDLGQDSVTATWQAPLRDAASIGLDEARELEAFGRSARQRVSDPDSGLGRLFNCCREYVRFQRIGTNLSTSIGFAVKDASERITAVEGPSRVLEGAALAVALVVVAAAGAFSIRTRRVEASWLFARGTSPGGVGAKSALESLLPCVAGGVLGFAVASTAVALFGPDGRVGSGAAADARIASTAGVLTALALIAVVSGRAFAGVVDPHGRRISRLAAAVPWELGLAGLAFVALDRLREGGAFVGDVVGARKPSLALVAFPFLFVAAFSILGARVARFLFAALRRATARSSAAPYLATRRLAASGALGVLLVAAAGLCLGTLLHAQIVARSLGTTVDAKAGVFVGADVAGGTNYHTPPPESFPLPMTRVVRFAAGARLPSGRPLDLLAVDARTLASAAYWHDGFSSDPLEEIAARLDAPEGGGQIPVVVAGGGDLTVDEIRIATVDVPVTVVAEATAFPGMYSLNPTIVVDRETMLALGSFPFDPFNNPQTNTELWVRGGERAVRDAFADMEFPPTTIVTAEEVKDIPYISAAINTFVVVNALGVVAGALTLVGALMYLQARQRAQIVSYALSTRMGLRHGQHRRALALELGAMLGFAFVVGAVLALVAARSTVPYLDPITAIPPDPLLVVPILAIVLTGLVVATFSWVGAAITNRRARTVDLGEVMRVAE